MNIKIKEKETKKSYLLTDVKCTETLGGKRYIWKIEASYKNRKHVYSIARYKRRFWLCLYCAKDIYYLTKELPIANSAINAIREYISKKCRKGSDLKAITIQNRNKFKKDTKEMKAFYAAIMRQIKRLGKQYARNEL